MKDSILLIMTPSMSLEKWNSRGQLSRELQLYSDLCKKSQLKLLIFSYGRNDSHFLKGYPDFTVLNMPKWIPKNIPFKLQNLIYHLSCIFYYRSFFKKVLLAKTNQFRAAEFGLILKFFYGIPLVVRMGFYYSHFMGLSTLKRWKEYVAFKSADAIITTSSEAAAFIVETYRISSQKLIWMCNSIDLNRFKPLNLIKEYDIIFVGKLEKQKNIRFLLEVLVGSGYKALIIGKGSLGADVRAAVGNDKNIEWLERVDNQDLPLYYNRSKCFILPSEYEGNPKVLLEAMACGLPAIITKVPGIRECIVDNISGAYIREDVESARSRISEILTNEEKSSLIAANALDWLNTHCTASKNINREINAYKKLLGDKKRQIPSSLLHFDSI